MAEGSTSFCEKIFNEYGDERSQVESTEYPYYCVASLQFIYGRSESGSYSVCSGTGFLCLEDGLYFIVTAAHLIFHEDDIPLLRVQISLGREDEVHPFGMILKDAKDAWVHPKYDKGLKPRKYDLAFILLDEQPDLVTKGFDKENYFILSPPEINQELQLSGYPAQVNKVAARDWKNKSQWKVDLTNCKKTDRLLHYKNATSAGNSGSPIFTEAHGWYHAVAMHVCGDEKYNKGLMFTRNIISSLDKKGLKQLEGNTESLNR